MNNSYKRMFLLLPVASMILCNVASSQTLTTSLATKATVSALHFNGKENGNRIKWTWQLPYSIKKAFNQSSFCDWYIEKMMRYNEDGKTVYALYLNNSCLLDGDHYDCFFKKQRLTVADDGTVVDMSTPE